MIVKTFKIPIYFGDFIVVIDDEFAGAYSDLRNRFRLGDLPEDFIIKTKDALAFNHPTESGYDRFFIFIKPDTKPGQIAHECKHVVNFLFNTRHIKLDSENDEPECYLLTFLVNKVHSVLNQNK